MHKILSDELAKLPTYKAAGIKWLNENYPDWRSVVTPEDLDMSDCEYCMIGQIVGDFYKLFANKYDKASSMAFTVPPRLSSSDDIDFNEINIYWKALEEAWLEEFG